jgi:hypothetical protein
VYKHREVPSRSRRSLSGAPERGFNPPGGSSNVYVTCSKRRRQPGFNCAQIASCCRRGEIGPVARDVPNDSVGSEELSCDDISDPGLPFGERPAPLEDE